MSTHACVQVQEAAKQEDRSRWFRFEQEATPENAQVPTCPLVLESARAGGVHGMAWHGIHCACSDCDADCDPTMRASSIKHALAHGWWHVCMVSNMYRSSTCRPNNMSTNLPAGQAKSDGRDAA